MYSSLKGIKTDILISQYDEMRSCSNMYLYEKQPFLAFSYVVESAKTGRLKLQLSNVFFIINLY